MTEADEVQARNERPDLFALADDLLEAEMIRAGLLTFTLVSEAA